MSTPITIEDIYKLFEKSQADLERWAKENDRRFAESDGRAAENERLAAERAAEFDRRVAESDRRFAERVVESARLAAERAAENDRRFAERVAENERLAAERFAESARLTAERVAENERLAAERVAENERLAAERVAERTAEFDRGVAEFDRRIAKLERTVDRTSKAVDALTTRWGRFVEELVEPAVLSLFQSRGIDIKEVYPRAKTRRQGYAMEIDILAVDDTEMVLVECKSRLSKEDVDYFLEKLSLFKDSFPHYKNYRAYGAVAGIEINEGIDRYAYHRGLFVIKPSGNTVMLANDADFKPIGW